VALKTQSKASNAGRGRLIEAKDAGHQLSKAITRW